MRTLKSLNHKEEFMTRKRISVKIQHKKGDEQSFFAERDKKLLRELREKATHEKTQKYCEEHKYHCFRCGTKSLAEIDEGNVKIDICVNKNCGAIHLDPGELKSIIKDQNALSAAKKAFLSVFK
jgi:protoporphyrinogen oxidase